MEDHENTQTKNLIHTLMDAGKASKKNGWAMSEILDEVSIKFGNHTASFAKAYILQLNQ